MLPERSEVTFSFLLYPSPKLYKYYKYKPCYFSFSFRACKFQSSIIRFIWEHFKNLPKRGNYKDRQRNQSDMSIRIVMSVNCSCKNIKIKIQREANCWIIIQSLAVPKKEAISTNIFSNPGISTENHAISQNTFHFQIASFSRNNLEFCRTCLPWKYCLLTR